jgi:hypothetical protein
MARHSMQLVAYEAVYVLWDANTKTLSLSIQAYEKLYSGLAVGANIMIGVRLGFAAYAKVKSVKVEKDKVYVELTTDGMNIKGGYATRIIKEQFEKMKSGGVKVYVIPHSDDVNVISPNFIDLVVFGVLRVELEVEGDKIMMKANETGGRVMTYNNVADRFSSISINKHFSMLNSATLVVITRDGGEMRFGVELLGRSQRTNDLWLLKVNDELMSKMTKDMIRNGGTDISYFIGAGDCRDCFRTL